MIAAAHVMAGLVSGVAALSVRVGALRVLTAFGLGVLSHGVLDAMPHSDYGSLSPSTLLIVVSIEIVATMTSALYVLRSQPFRGYLSPLLAGLAGAMLPDAKFAAPWLPERVQPMVLDVSNRFHAPFHASPTPVAVGLLVEIVSTLSLIGVFWLLVRRLTDPHART